MTGIYQTGDADLATVTINNQPNKPGDPRLADLDGDNKITTADKTVIGQIDPEDRFSLTNNFGYRNFSLGVTLTAMTGWDAPYFNLDPRKVYGQTPLGNAFPNAPDVGFWTVDNPSTTRPSATYQNSLNHSYYASRDFLKVQNISLTYTFKQNVLDKAKIGFTSARVFLNARNVATFTKWPGFEPEGSMSVALERDVQRYQGYENFPMARSFVLGLNLGF
jgi:hypothetical protein